MNIPDRWRVSISQQDWSLHRNAPADEARHNEKIKEAIKDNLQSIINDGSIITADPSTKKIIKIPLRSLELPHIRHSSGDEGVGTGDGDEEVGDIIYSEPSGGKDGKAGQGAGNEPGAKHYEVELTIEELQQLVFEDLGLPNLLPKQQNLMPSEEVVFEDIRKKRSTTNLDIFRTIKVNMQRNAQETGIPFIGNILPEDYRVKSWEIKEQKANAAVIIAMRDISGSMGDFENYIVRSFCWWSTMFLRSRFPQVEIVFVVHDTEAEEVSEDDFFKRGSSGGTVCSSANELALELIQNRYPPENFNIYVLHFSDGDNWGGDDDKICASLVQQMLNLNINQYAFVQIGRPESSLLSEYRRQPPNNHFNDVCILKKEDVWSALQKVFDKNKELSSKK